MGPEVFSENHDQSRCVCVYMTAVHSPEQLPRQCLHLECATLMALWETGDILELCVLVGRLLPEGFITF